MKIGFIGIGKLGLPCAEEMANAGHSVNGYDISPVSSKLVNVVESIKEVVHAADIVFIAVPTPHDAEYDGSVPTSHLKPKDFSYDTVKECLIAANEHMNDTQLLVLISTVLPGTTRSQFIDLIDNTRFIYNPYLIAMGSVAWDMINPEMVLIGTRDGSETGDAQLLTDFYKSIMQNSPRYIIGTWDECECVKVFYNTFISTKVTLVNMIQDVAEKQGNINVDVVTDALANATMRIMGPQYMTAGMGDGGACHPRDNIALRYMASELNMGYDLFDAIMGAREIQAKNKALKLISLSEKYNLPIYIHGKAFKPQVNYIEGSYSLLVGHYIEELGHVVTYIDPLTEDYTPASIKGVVLLAHSCSVTYRHTNTNEPDVLYCEFEPGTIVLDPWRKFMQDDCVVIHYGNTRSSN